MGERITARWAFPVLIALAVAVHPAGGDEATTQAEGLALRVVTYNIEGGTQGGRIHKNLSDLAGDIICLQEVRRGSRGVNLFAGPLGMTGVFGPYGRGANVGLAILARGEIEPVEILRMPGERNFALIADVTIKETTLRVVCIHFKSLPRPLISGAIRSMGVRTQQASAVVAAAKTSPYPVIVAGDTNSLPLSPEYLTLASALTDCCAVTRTTTQPTIFAGGQGYRIDHVFLFGPWSVLSCRAPAVDGSDHRPVAADVLLSAPTSRPATPAASQPASNSSNRSASGGCITVVSGPCRATALGGCPCRPRQLCPAKSPPGAPDL